MNQKYDFDVVVVGAGPTGSSAAYKLARAGLNVAVIDKVTFPRMKPCGGGLTIKTLNLMPYSVGPVVRSATKVMGMGVKTPFAARFELFEADSYVCAFTVREEFDKFNFDRMIEQGVEFIADGSLEDVDEQPSGVELTFAGRKLIAKYLIGADGANSVVRRLTSAGKYFARGFAMEGIVPYSLLDKTPETEFFFGYVKNGYGWLFPKGDHVNVGIYTYDSDVTLGKDLLRKYCYDRLGTDALEHIVGFPLGFGGQRYVPGRDRILLAGDAAGFAEPLLGEGLHNAIKSGQAAADAIIKLEVGMGENLRKAYKDAISPIVSDLWRCDDMKTFFYRNMDGIGFGALKFPISKTALMKGFAAGKTMQEITSRFFFSPFFVPSVPPTLKDFLTRVSAEGRIAPTIMAAAE